MVRRDVIPFARPASLDQAFQLLSSQSWSVLAGGTDFFPAHVAKPINAAVLDISRLSDLRKITLGEDAWRLGALVTWTDILRADLPPAFEGLKLAAREIGSVQIQNVGTLGGNLCNASPAADSVPPLLTLEAEVELSSKRGQHRLPLADFITGYRATARRSDELLTAVLIPKHAARGQSTFKKLGARKYLVISVAMAAARLEIEDGRIVTARIALGACSPISQRLTSLEGALLGRHQADLGAMVTADHLKDLSPIDDIRATAHYRREAALELVKRTVLAAAEAGA